MYLAIFSFLFSSQSKYSLYDTSTMNSWYALTRQLTTGLLLSLDLLTAQEAPEDKIFTKAMCTQTLYKSNDFITNVLHNSDQLSAL